ncbi:hypothetical protein A6U88_30210 [Agrobacterium sp. B131/95]|nr:hypothetical protein A6U88_30210 [Agrobacterium sp. B131/95]
MIEKGAAETFEILLHSYDADSHMIVPANKIMLHRVQLSAKSHGIYGLPIGCFGIYHQDFRISYSLSSQITKFGELIWRRFSSRSAVGRRVSGRSELATNAAHLRWGEQSR